MGAVREAKDARIREAILETGSYADAAAMLCMTRVGVYVAARRLGVLLPEKPKRGRYDADIREAFDAGFTVGETAKLVGVASHYISRRCDALGIRAKRHGSSRPDPRTPFIAALYKDGFTLQQIGDQYGISRERVRQILRKRTDLKAEEGGRSARAAKAQQDRRTKREAASMANYGCGWEDYQRIKRLGHEMEAKGVGSARTPIGAFRMQKHNANRRNIAWELTFWQWWSIWQASGKWEQRGRGQGYVMCRRGDVGPYSLSNVFIDTAARNSSKGCSKNSGLPVGVTATKSGKFEANRMIGGTFLRLGTFPTPELAYAAYLAAGAEHIRRAA